MNSQQSHNKLSLLAFIEIYHKQQVIAMKKQLEEENWQPADIPYSYMSFFILFFDPSHEFVGPDAESIENGSSILTQSPQDSKKVPSQQTGTDTLQTQESDHEEDLPKKVIPDEESKNPTNGQPKKKSSPIEESGFVKIMKNELFIDEKRYKLTSSVLLLVRIIYDYLHLGQKFKGISMDCMLKTIEIVKVSIKSQ